MCLCCRARTPRTFRQENLPTDTASPLRAAYGVQDGVRQWQCTRACLFPQRPIAFRCAAPLLQGKSTPQEEQGTQASRAVPALRLSFLLFRNTLVLGLAPLCVHKRAYRKKVLRPLHTAPHKKPVQTRTGEREPCD